MAKKVTCNGKSMEELRRRYLYVEVVEKRIPHTFIAKDLFGFADIIAINSAETVLVQTTTRTHVNARIAKILASPAAKLWVLGENRRILVHGWSKKGPRGKRKLWEFYEEEITEANFDFPPSQPIRNQPPPKSNYEMAKSRN